MSIPADNRPDVGYFLTTFLGRPASSIPKGAQWIVEFDDLMKNILPAIDLAYRGEPSEQWKTKEASRVLLDPLYQKNKGCLFCQAIEIPGEGSTPVPEGIKSNAFIRDHVGAGRNDFGAMRMSFLETNISFAETFLRGWALATAKFGMIARAGAKNYRTNLTCYKFSSSPQGIFIAHKIQFYGVCCVSVGSEEYNYDHMTSVVKRDAQFVYHYYSIDAVEGMNPNIKGNKAI